MADAEEVADGDLDAGGRRIVPEHAQEGGAGVEGIAQGSHGAPDVADDARALQVTENHRLSRADAHEIGVAARAVPA